MTDSAATKPSPVQLTLTLPQMELLADMFDERFLDLWNKTEFDEFDLPPIAFAIHCRKALEASVEAGYPPHIVLRTVREVAQSSVESSPADSQRSRTRRCSHQSRSSRRFC